MQRMITARWLLIAALSLVFALFGIGKFLSPEIWIGWIPLWMEGFLGLSREWWLQIIGAIEIVLALGVLLPIRSLRRVVTLGMSLHLIIVLTQTGWNDVAIRDIGLLLSALALLVLL